MTAISTLPPRSSFLLLTSLLSILLLPFSPVSSQSLLQLGWETDSTATSQLELSSEAILDLHCNPVQQFLSLPAAGATLHSFVTTYDPSSTTVTGTCRMALYGVLPSSSYQLLAATSAALGSDIQMAPSSVAGPVDAQSGGSLYYPSGGPVVLLPSLSYSLCFTTNGGLLYVNGTTVNGTNGVNGTVAQYRWADSQVNHALVPYDLSQPLPNPLTFTSAQVSSGTWQMWMVAAIGNFTFTSSSSSSATPTSARAVSSSLTSPRSASSSVTSAPTVTSAPAAAVGGGGGGTVWELGFKTDPTATSPMSAGGETIFDLHCNPVQQFSSLPATGASLLNFVTAYDPTLTTVSGICRMALYLVSNSSSTYTLLAATSAALGSDIPLGPGSTPGPVTVSNPGSIYYPNGPVTLLPTLSYSICFINNGANLYVNGTTVNGTNGINGTIAQYHWSDSLVNNDLLPYDVANPLPSPLVFTQTSSMTWQIWITATNTSTTSSGSVRAASAAPSTATPLASSAAAVVAASSSAAVSAAVAVTSPAAGSSVAAVSSVMQGPTSASSAPGLTSAAPTSTPAAATSTPNPPASSTGPVFITPVPSATSTPAVATSTPAAATSALSTVSTAAAGAPATSSVVASSTAPGASPVAYGGGAQTASSVSIAAVIGLVLVSGLTLLLQ